MGRRTIGIVVIVIIVLAVGGVLLATHNGGKTYNQNTPNSDMNTMDMNGATSSQGNSQPVATDKVTIQNFAFTPAAITVKKGTVVTWTNNDSTTHTVTENDSQTGPDSGNLEPGKSYSFTFTTTGTFHYHCAIHPDMLGTVTVTE